MTPSDPRRPDLALVKAAARAGFKSWRSAEDEESYGLVALTEAQWERLNSGVALPTAELEVDGLRVAVEVREGRYLVYSDDRVDDGLFTHGAGASGMTRLVESFLLAECRDRSVSSLAAMSAHEFLPLFVGSEVSGLREVTFPRTQYRHLERLDRCFGTCFPCECGFHECQSVACWKENGTMLLWLASSGSNLSSVAFYPSVSCGSELEYPVTPGTSPWKSRPAP